jgi:SNF2 family DNA or RNA helicase
MKHPALFLDPRLGKSVIIAKLLKWWGSERSLIVAPLSTIPDWCDELAEESILATRMSSLDWQREEHGYGCFITNYEALRGNRSVAIERWDAVVLDESTRIKNPRAAITKLCMRGFEQVTHRSILTGLANPETPLEFIPQFLFTKRSFCGYRDYWHARSGMFTEMGYEWQPKKGMIKRIHTELKHNAIQLTCKQAGVGNKRVSQTRRLQRTAKQKKLLRELHDTWTAGDRETKWRTVVYQWEARLAGGFSDADTYIGSGKVQDLKQLLGELHGQQVVICARFNAELGYLAKKLGQSYILLNGANRKTREVDIKRFQKGEARIALMQTKVGMHGLNLSNADTIVFYSLPPSLEEYVQTIERIEHLTKVATLLIIHLVTENTIDVDVLAACKMKKSDARFYQGTVFRNWQKRVSA